MCIRDRLTSEDIARAERGRTDLYYRVAEFFESYDLLLTPTTVVPPFDVGERYVAEVDGHWVGLLSFGQAAYHLRDRDDWIGWTNVQRGRRLSLIAQNTRFVLLHDRGQFPNLARGSCR